MITHNGQIQILHRSYHFSVDGIVHLSNDDVKISDIKWVTKGTICEVDFTVTNDSHANLVRNVKIVAHKQRTIGEGAIVNDILGNSA